MRKNNVIKWIVGVSAAALVLWLGYYFLAFPNHADADDRVQTGFGKIIYDGYCANCHGRNLEGQADWRLGPADRTFRAPPHDETGHSWQHSDRYLFEHTKHGGKALMPPGYLGYMRAMDISLTDVEIWSVLAYIKSRWPPAIRARQNEMNREVGLTRRH